MAVFERQGRRYLFERGEDALRIWRRLPGNVAVRRWCYSHDQTGWEQAQAQYVRLEPQSVPADPGLAPRLLGPWSVLVAGLAAVIAVAGFAWGGYAAVAGTRATSLAAQRITGSAAAAPGTAASSASDLDEDAASASGTGWLATGDTEVVFLQWTRSGDKATGTLSASTLKGSATTVSGTSAAFTAVFDGDSVSLTFPLGLGTTKTLTGTLAHDTLRLNATVDNGSISTSVFTPATAADYNAAVTRLGEIAGGNASAEATASAQAAQAAAVDQAARARHAAVDRAATAVTNDLGDLARTLKGLSGDATSTSGDVAGVRSALTQTQSDAATVQTDVEQGSDATCSDAAGVGSDAAGVESAAAGITSDATGAQQDDTQVGNAISRLQQDQQALNTAISAAPGYVPQNGIPSAATISSAIHDATSARSAAAKTVAQAQHDAQALVDQAHAIAKQAATAGHCS